jgi:hypothetical protein
MLIHNIRVVLLGTGLLLGQESNEGRVLGLLYRLSRLAIVFNNILYMYKVLKDIYTWCFSRNFGGTAVPYAPTVDPPLTHQPCSRTALKRIVF